LSKLGPTDKHPNGKLNKDDEGEIRFAVGSHDGNVILDFGSPVAWVGMPPPLARQLAAMLIRHANAIEGH